MDDVDDERISFSSESEEQDEAADGDQDHGYYPWIGRNTRDGKLYLIDESLQGMVHLPSRHGSQWRLERDAGDPMRVKLVQAAVGSTTKPRWVHQLLTCSKVIPYECLGLDLFWFLQRHLNPSMTLQCWVVSGISPE